MSNNYDDIDALEGLEAIRIRPGMYAGDYLNNEYNCAPMNIFGEILGNSIDEFMGGHCHKIEIFYIPATNIVRIKDYGRGIPFSHNEKEGMNNLEIACSKIHSGKKFSKGDGKEFKFSLGMNGCGTKITNALSSHFKCQSFRQGKVATLVSSQGITKSFNIEENTNDPEFTGTIVEWLLDPECLPFNYQLNHLKRKCQESAYLNAGLIIELNLIHDSELTDGTQTFIYIEPEGIQAYHKFLINEKKSLVNFPTFKSEDGDVRYEIQMSVCEGSSEQYHAFVNGSAIEQASSPVVALRKEFAKTLIKYIENFAKLNAKQKKIKINTYDIRSGIYAVIKILHHDPAFDAQTKNKLVNNDIKDLIAENVPDQLLEYLINNPLESNKLIAQAYLQASARIKAEQAREQVLKKSGNLFSVSNISFDIYTPPLNEHSPHNSLYLFEGQSASGALLKAAKEINPETGSLYKENIGILALKGITLNALEVTLSRVAKNVEYSTLMKVARLNQSNPDDLSTLAFDKFIIATDMDSGGDHIATLIMIFFAVHFPEVIRQKKLCRVMTPLFEVTDKKKKKIHFIYPDENKEQALKLLGFNAGMIGKRIDIKRNKGLGELGVQSGMTLVDNPRFQNICPDVDIETLIDILTVFSGKKTIPLRKELIMKKGLILT